MHELGTGVLDWEREERISDRYGLVELFLRPGELVKLNRVTEQLHGKLFAIVREVRESHHIGDLFHGVGPTVPEVGERVELGTGAIFFEDDAVGLVPDDYRTTLWLDIRGLYRLHNQTVTLYFEESPRY
jgi:hypothetical protein